MTTTSKEDTLNDNESKVLEINNIELSEAVLAEPSISPTENFRADENKQYIPHHVDVKKLFALAFSSGGVQAMVAVVSILTIKIIAPLGSDVLAGVIAGQRIYFSVIAILLGLNVGSMALISRSFGEKNTEQANAWLRLTLLVTTVITLGMGLIFLMIPELLLNSLGLENNSLKEGVNYIQILAYFGWIIGFYVIFAGGLRASGYASVPLISGIVLNLSSLVITYVFVQYDWILTTEWAGTLALAAALGNVIGVIFLLYLKRNRLREIFIASWTFKGSSQLLKISSPAIFEQLIRQVAMLAFMWIVAHYGTAAFAAYGSSVMLITVSLVVGFGFSIATAVMVGQAVGAGSTIAAKQIVKTSLITSISFMSAIGLIFGFFSYEIALWMVGEGDVAYYTSILILFYAIIQPVMAVDFVMTGALQGSGDTRWPLLSVILSNVIIRFGIASILLYFEAPIEWVFATVFVDYIAKAGLLAWRVYGCNWLVKKDI